MSNTLNYALIEKLKKEKQKKIIVTGTPLKNIKTRNINDMNNLLIATPIESQKPL